MLRELHISNLAIIADARIELHAGLNCFTGATGAGKSLVIGAIEVLLGLRSPGEMLRPGADEGRVSGVFEVKNPDLLAAIERATDVRVSSDGGEVLLTRRLYASGRSSVSLNGHPITLSMLKLVAEQLVDVHGQHDHQYLLKPSNQIDVLDQFGNLWELRRAYHATFEKLQSARRQLEDLSASRTLREQQLELYRFQADEIDNAELSAAEFEELGARASVLTNLEKLKKETGATYAALYETDGAVLERLKMMSAVLAELSGLDVTLKPIADGVRDATLGLEESAFDLSRYLGKLDLDPAELTEVADRLNTINRIVNKYGNTLEATLEYRQQIGKKIEELERATEDLSSLQSSLAPLAKDLKNLGAELSTRRQATAKKLSPLIEKQLAELGMERATFTVGFAAAESQIKGENVPASASGFDAIEFIARTNPGQSPQPLRKIASGGELSRIMLALKGILAQSDRVSVLVFDEIDSNVGGRLGSVIGEKLRQLAAHHQVLCITHLPQIASYADRHLTVRKAVSGNDTQASVRTMENSERIEELAEMIGGQRITETTRSQARELLESAATPHSSPAVVAENARHRQTITARSQASQKIIARPHAPSSGISHHELAIYPIERRFEHGMLAAREGQDWKGVMQTSDEETYHFCVICPSAQQIYLIGDFNNWSTTSTPMTQTESSVWQISLHLRGGAPRQFSYFVIDKQWLTGQAAFGTTFCLPGSWSAVVRENPHRAGKGDFAASGA